MSTEQASAPPPQTCGALPLHHNVRISGDDIGSCAGCATAEACCAACRAHAGCKAFLFVKKGTCWLKSAAEGNASCAGCVWTGATRSPTWDAV